MNRKDRKVSIKDLEKISNVFAEDIRFFLGYEIESDIDLKNILRIDKELSKLPKGEKEKIISFVEFIKSENRQKVNQ
ncbi:MAG: hypothetical protein RLZZ361_738 [Cyanobacteriota bacterium]